MAERGGSLAGGHGNSVPRFHIVWGTRPEIVEPSANKVMEAAKTGLIDFKPRHRVDELIIEKGSIVGVSGIVLEESDSERGKESNRNEIAEFEYRADAIVVASGGISANLELVKKNWPSRLGKAPDFMVQGVPSYVDDEC